MITKKEPNFEQSKKKMGVNELTIEMKVKWKWEYNPSPYLGFSTFFSLAAFWFLLQMMDLEMEKTFLFVLLVLQNCGFQLSINFQSTNFPNRHTTLLYVALEEKVSSLIFFFFWPIQVVSRLVSFNKMIKKKYLFKIEMRKKLHKIT